MNVYPRLSQRTFCLSLAIGLLVGPLWSENRPDSGTPFQKPGALRIEIHKAARKLHLYSGDQLVATHPVGLGFSPVGHKSREGDGKTPEGPYSICIKNPHSSYYLSVGIDYPSSRDAERGLAAGLISASQARAIARAERNGACPPWNTDLGGEIFIHGRGSSSDWTLGCIALDDPEMKRLFDAVTVGTRVEIKP